MSEIKFSELPLATPLTGLEIIALVQGGSSRQSTVNAIKTKLQSDFEPVIPTGTTNEYVRGNKTLATLDKAAVGLSNVVNADTTTTANIADSLDKRFVTDAQRASIGTMSGTNTGDETTATIKAKLGVASTSTDGYLTAVDWNTFNNKLDSLGFTAENVANKATDLTSPDNTKYTTTLAVSNALATKQDASSAIVLGTTSTTAHRGDFGTTAYNHSQTTGNPHSTTKADVGLGNVDNTSDTNKPISTATQTALNGKEPTITAGTTTQYYRGDKTFQTLNTDVVAPTATNVYLSPAQKALATQTASTGQTGLLSSTDWNTFNGKESALPTTFTAGTYGNSTQYPIVTFNNKGIATGVTLQTVTATVGDVSDSALRVVDNSDPTKKMAFEASNISTATTRTYTLADKNVDFREFSSVAASDGNTIATGATRCRILGGQTNTVSASNVGLCLVNTNKIVGSNITCADTTVIGGNSTGSSNGGNAGITAQVSLIAFTSDGGTGSVSLTTTGTTPSSTNVPKAILNYNPSGQSSAVHEVDFSVDNALDVLGSYVSQAVYTGKRRVTVYRDGSGTYFVSSVQTIGTDAYIGTTQGTVTLGITVDTTNNRIVPTVTRSGNHQQTTAQAVVRSIYTNR